MTPVIEPLMMVRQGDYILEIALSSSLVCGPPERPSWKTPSAIDATRASKSFVAVRHLGYTMIHTCFGLDNLPRFVIAFVTGVSTDGRRYHPLSSRQMDSPTFVELHHMPKKWPHLIMLLHPVQGFLISYPNPLLPLATRSICA